MKIKLLTACIVCLSAICNGQEKGTDTTKVRFDPPVIVKDEEVKAHSKEKMGFTPPVIVRDRPSKTKNPKRKEPVRFKPPVIVKD